VVIVAIPKDRMVGSLACPGPNRAALVAITGW
jgi:hypothetical protein